MYVQVTVTASAKKEVVTTVSPTRYDIRVKEPAERNLANRRVATLLAEACGVPPRAVKLISGHRSPRKIFSIDN